MPICHPSFGVVTEIKVPKSSKKTFVSSKIIAIVSTSGLIFYNFGRLWLFIPISGYLRLFNLYSHLYKLVIFDYKSELIYLSVSHR